MNCKYRKEKSYIDKKGMMRSWGVCKLDNRSCNEWSMKGYDCYRIRDEDSV